MPAFAVSSDYLETGPGRREFLRETSHELIREIGGGAYGKVWLARSVTGAYRAIKVVFRSDFKSDTPYDREYRGILKFEPISRGHDGFIDILHVGRNDQTGYFYYVMELGDDAKDDPSQPLNLETYAPRTLDSERRRHRRLPFEETLRLALKLTLALGALHKAGLVHRDIKPSNIILAGGQPKLADIGLVTDAGAEVSFVGTEGYIPPEGPGGAPADIYSLGKVLYEISTGNDRNQFPELPVDLLTETDATNRFVEFNEILIKACESKVQGRYQTAEELHAHLALLQAGRSVKRLLELERMFQTVRRYLPIGVFLAVAVGIYVFLFLREHQREIVERQRQVATTVGFGARAVESGDLLGALPLFVEALHLDQADSYKERTHRLRLGSLLQRSPRPVQMWYFPHNKHHLNYAEFSPDDNHVLMANQDGLSAIYDVATRERVSPLFGTGRYREKASLSPDGRYAVLSDRGKAEFVIWNMAKQTNHLVIQGSKANVAWATFSPQSDRILTASVSGRRATLWDAETGRELFSVGHMRDVWHAAFSADGSRIVTGSLDGWVKVWSARNGEQLSQFAHGGEGLVTPVYCVAFSPDGQYVASGGSSDDRKVHVWNLETRQEKFTPLEHGDGIASICFSRDGRFIVTASWDTTVRIWNATTGKAINPPLKHSGKAMHACFSSDAKRVLTVCYDGFVTVWDVPLDQATPLPTTRTYSPNGLRYLTRGPSTFDVYDATTHALIGSVPDPGNLLLAPRFDDVGEQLLIFAEIAEAGASASLGIQSWRVRGGSSNGPLIRTALDLTNAVLSADGRHLALLARRRAECWDTRTGRQLGAFPLVTASAKAVFDPSGQRIAVGQHDKVDILDVTTGRPVLKAPLQHPPDMKISSLDFSRDGRQLVAAYMNDIFERGAAQIWRAADGSAVGPPLKHRDGVTSARFNPDGRYVVTTSEDFDAIIWDAKTSTPLPTPPFHHDHQVHTAAFSDDSRWLITAGRDKTARIWECLSGDALTLPYHHPVEVVRARFVAGGRQVLTEARDGRAWLWDLPNEKRTIEELKVVAQLLSGRRASRASAGILQIEEVVWESWQRLHTNFASTVPKPISTSPN